MDDNSLPVARHIHLPAQNKENNLFKLDYTKCNQSSKKKKKQGRRYTFKKEKKKQGRRYTHCSIDVKVLQVTLKLLIPILEVKERLRHRN
jgi:hypothetical protein